MIDKELVAACYHSILGREPENSQVVVDKVEHSPSYEALLHEFLNSAEFRRRFLKQTGESQRVLLPAVSYYDSGYCRIDVDVSEAELAALFDRLRNQWCRLGEQEPFWSVLTYEKYRLSNLDGDARADFFETGAEFARLIEAFCIRHRAEIRHGVCVELGCGVGRVTTHLAKMFEKVIAIDVSDGNLRQCEWTAKELGISNIECLLLRSAEDLHNISEYDFLFSTMVLQHAPPPIQKFQLSVLLSKLRQGGGFLFQTQTYHPEYSFDCAKYLASGIDLMDMHSLPMQEIFMLAETLGVRIREVALDCFTGRLGSYTFFGLAPE